VQSIDWQLLTMTASGQAALPPRSAAAVWMCAGLEDAEFSIPGLILADVAVADGPIREDRPGSR
jgi:hypothetical protein